MRQKSRLTIGLLFGLAILPPILLAASLAYAACGDFPPPNFEDPSDSLFSGNFYNCNWGYSVKIPEGMIGRNVPPPAPQHGFGILFSRHPKAYIWVDGSANSLEWSSPAKASQFYVETIRKDATKVRSLARRRTTLNGIRAVRLTITYECSDITMVEDHFISIDLKRQIVYEIALLVERSAYASYKKALEDIARSFRLKPRC